MPAKKIVKKPVKHLFKKIELKPAKQAEKKIVLEPPATAPKPTENTCACGAPLAPGQTYVCKDHIRKN